MYAMPAPSRRRFPDTEPLLSHRFETPLGSMEVIAGPLGVSLLEFTDTARLQRERDDLCRLMSTDILPGQNEGTRQAEHEITEYFQGIRRVFSVPLFTPGTPFQQGVSAVLRDIPYGQTISYQHEARILSNPRAIRAVAAANGANRVSIIIPCHRVIGKNGTLVGYGGGLSRKQQLLAHEQEWEQPSLWVSG